MISETNRKRRRLERDRRALERPQPGELFMYCKAAIDSDMDPKFVASLFLLTRPPPLPPYVKS
jgi:hypothetical protein